MAGPGEEASRRPKALNRGREAVDKGRHNCSIRLYSAELQSIETEQAEHLAA